MTRHFSVDPVPRRGDEPFLFGNIPLEILKRVTALRGPCLPVYLAVWHRTKLARSERSVTLPNAVALIQWNVRRDAKIRALKELEAAGLIMIEKAVGRAWRITLRDPRPIVQKPKGTASGEGIRS